MVLAERPIMHNNAHVTDGPGNGTGRGRAAAAAKAAPSGGLTSRQSAINQIANHRIGLNAGLSRARRQ